MASHSCLAFLSDRCRVNSLVSSLCDAVPGASGSWDSILASKCKMEPMEESPSIESALGRYVQQISDK